MKLRLFRASLIAVWAWSSAGAQENVPRVGYLRYTTEASDSEREWFVQGLRELGWEDGRNIKIKYRYAGDDTAALSRLAKELVALQVAVIVTAGTPPIRAALDATSTIPVVSANVSDPIAAGFANSLPRPGKNFTGVTLVAPELAPKRIELLKHLVSGATRIGILRNPSNSAHAWDSKAAKDTAASLSLSATIFDLAGRADVSSVFSLMRDANVHALMVLDDGAFNAIRFEIAAEALRNRLPTMCVSRQHAEAGCLMSYGVVHGQNTRRAAAYVDKILKGANPAELPIERPMKFEFLINQRTAGAMGLHVPESMVVFADELIE